MTRFVNETLSDMRGGRQSWRVVAAFSLPAFLISVLAAFAQHAF